MIVGKTINLRALNQRDSKQILDWVNNPTLKYFTGTVYPVSDVEHELWFHNKLSDKLNRIFAIEEQESCAFVGIIGLNNTDLINRSTELYIYIGDEKYWGRGTGTDAIKALVSFVFNELNLHRISLSVFSYNKRAIHTYEKVGFVTEGIMKESLFKSGKYHDKVIMAIINEKQEIN